MQRLYDDTNDHEPSSDAAPESSGDADLHVDPFGSNTQSDQPASGIQMMPCRDVPEMRHAIQHASALLCL